MGHVPVPPPPPRLNLDRFGMPRDYATYMWLLYRERVTDDSPARRAFLNGPVPRMMTALTVVAIEDIEDGLVRVVAP